MQNDKGSRKQRLEAGGHRPGSALGFKATLWATTEKLHGKIPKGWSVERFDKHIAADRGLSYNGEGLRGTGLPMPNLNSVCQSGGCKHEGIKYCAGEYKALGLGVPLQILRPSTFDRTLKAKEKDDHAKSRSLQDEATCAWNFFVALYYKAGGYSWRLVRDQTQPKSCFIGISFYESLDRTRLNASVAQVFDERGHGLLVQGGGVNRDDPDRQARMDETGAYTLIKKALKNYQDEHWHYPGRVVIHKTSTFNKAEQTGALRALGELQIRSYDLLSVVDTSTRLVRDNYYPPLRGTLWEMDDKRSLLYTNGSVQLYEEYPGLYVPRSVIIHHDLCSTEKPQIATEVLTLTKMNWNNSQITAIEPITVRAARQVGRIIKYADATQGPVPYWFFM